MLIYHLTCEGACSPETIARARPSAMAVLPTPGSPSRMGLFFLFLASTCTTRATSLSRPITCSPHRIAHDMHAFVPSRNTNIFAAMKCQGESVECVVALNAPGPCL